MKTLRVHTVFFLALVAILPLASINSFAQEKPEKLPTKEDLANNNKLFIELATKVLHWDEPTDPVKMVGPLYFVGTRGLSSFIFATNDGLIMLNTGSPKSGPLIAASIRKLGFKPEDIKIIINGHGHSDHAGAFAYFKQLSGAQIAIMDPDVAMIEDGGKSDFHYGKDWQIMGQPPVKVDRVLHDGDTVTLGEVTLTAHHTPGHTKGATTWTTTLIDGGKSYKVVFPDGGGFNPGYRIAKNESYPGINSDYRNTLHFLEMQQPDIWAGHHCEYFDMEGKKKRYAREGIKVWIDPEGYRRFIASKRRAFEDEVDAEMGVQKKAPPKKESASALFGKRWVLTELNGEAVSASQPYLQFDDKTKRYSGDAGCNRITGGVQVEGVNIKLTQGASTRRACADPNKQKVENDLLKMLPTATSFQIDDDGLRIMAGDRNILTFKLQG